MNTVVAAMALACAAAGAAASPCGDKIAELQARYDHAPLAAGSPPVGASGAAGETVDAKLHHQPAPASAADANDPAMSAASVKDAQFRVAMEEATAAQHSGDEATCEASVAKAERAYPR